MGRVLGEFGSLSACCILLRRGSELYLTAVSPWSLDLCLAQRNTMFWMSLPWIFEMVFD